MNFRLRDWNVEEKLRRQMEEAGFSARACKNVPQVLPLGDLAQLRTCQWEDTEAKRGVRWLVSIAPNCGPRIMAELEAYRAGKDPREARPPGPVRVSVALGDAELAALDAWIARQPRKISRAEAIKALVANRIGLAAE
jgi:hypothetical protein